MFWFQLTWFKWPWPSHRRPRIVSGTLIGRHLSVSTNDSLSFTSADLRRFTEVNEVTYSLYHFGVFSDQLSCIRPRLKGKMALLCFHAFQQITGYFFCFSRCCVNHRLNYSRRISNKNLLIALYIYFCPCLYGMIVASSFWQHDRWDDRLFVSVKQLLLAYNPTPQFIDENLVLQTRVIREYVR